MATETTLVLIKPDAVQRGHIGDILNRFERKGLSVVGMQFLKAPQAIVEAHYAEHKERPFFGDVVKFLTSSPIVALAISGNDAISVVRTLMGATDGRKSPPGTIRGDFGCSLGANLVHGSDSAESAERELALWFPNGTVDWEPCTTPWLDA